MAHDEARPCCFAPLSFRVYWVSYGELEANSRFVLINWVGQCDA